MDTTLYFRSGSLILEGLYRTGASTQGAVIAHPHPLYGGDMTNPVVETIATVYQNRGYATLRFNFRGVGASEGHYDNGTGEQQDVLAAIEFLVRQGYTSIHLAGYSFGSWVLSRLDELPREIAAMAFVSPPVALIPFKPNLNLPLLRLVITGEEDEIAPPGLVAESLNFWNPEARFEIIDSADHFYYGMFRELGEKIDVILAG
ncbi:alpha/beta hydrolase [Desulforhopalus singaporensis]|uniref:AB hydrolase-1 domain-containing protein n=1 Tax=Desulforhopalus singaporensis TaxID=91360 RepID=A0A1H0UN50_9BACT|nr:alpha/beta fold hydrolase [Desulforhopalus singaporensis]SDP67503.1 hypothetical protein SAMN05660330_03632 [Desulforhopalus singaporensis]